MKEISYSRYDDEISYRPLVFIVEIVLDQQHSMSDEQPKEELAPELMELFRTFGSKSVMEQMKFFLRSFWRDDDIDLKEVFLFANYFKLKFDGDHSEHNEFELDHAAELFQKLGNPKTALQIKQELRKYDVDSNGRMSFVEFAMMWWKKPLNELLTRDIDGDGELLAARKAAQAVVAEIEKGIADAQEKVSALEEIVAHGGVKKFSAQQDLHKITDEEVPELKNRLRESKMALAVAVNDLQKAGSALDADLKEAGLVEFSPSLNQELHEKYPKIERDV